MSAAFLKNTWYVAAWSYEVPEDGLLARIITQLPLLFWRNSVSGALEARPRSGQRIELNAALHQN